MKATQGAALHCAPLVRRWVDSRMRGYWFYFDGYLEAIARGEHPAYWHHAIGSVLQALSEFRLYAVADRIYNDLNPDRQNLNVFPIETVEAAMAPVRALSIETIAMVEERLGPVPPLEAVPLLDLDWLQIVVRDGDDAKTRSTRRPTTIGEAEDAVARLSTLLEAMNPQGLDSTGRLPNRVWMSARWIHAFRVMAAAQALDEPALRRDPTAFDQELQVLRQTVVETLSTVGPLLSSR